MTQNTYSGSVNYTYPYTATGRKTVKTTVTEEFKNGKLVKRTVVTEESYHPAWNNYPLYQWDTTSTAYKPIITDNKWGDFPHPTETPD